MLRELSFLLREGTWDINKEKDQRELIPSCPSWETLQNKRQLIGQSENSHSALSSEPPMNVWSFLSRAFFLVTSIP